jgi:hypothetical protein
MYESSLTACVALTRMAASCYATYLPGRTMHPGAGFPELAPVSGIEARRRPSAEPQCIFRLVMGPG